MYGVRRSAAGTSSVARDTYIKKSSEYSPTTGRRVQLDRFGLRQKKTEDTVKLTSSEKFEDTGKLIRRKTRDISTGRRTTTRRTPSGALEFSTNRRLANGRRESTKCTESNLCKSRDRCREVSCRFSYIHREELGL